jgi:peptide/nickel transport system substrate-binding protein
MAFSVKKLRKKANKVLKIVFLFKFLDKKEQKMAKIFFLLLILGLLGVIFNTHFLGAKILPAQGGTYREALFGYPRYLNPVLSHVNDVDRDIVNLVYSGLMKFDSDGNLIPDIAKSFEVANNGKTYDFYLRKNVFWHDGKPLIADDIIYTISIIQDARYNSPLRFNWEGVTIEKINDWQIRFSLKNPYAPFLANTTLGILPKHIWEKINYEKFALAKENLSPVGTGPFKLKKIKKSNQNFIKEIILTRNERYYLKNAYLENVVFYFYFSEKELITALAKNNVDAIGLSSSFRKNNIDHIEKYNIFYPFLPRYFAIFFNQEQSSFLSNKDFRTALAHSVNKDAIIKEIFEGEALKINSPLLPYLFNDQLEPLEGYEYNLNKAKEYMDKTTSSVERTVTENIELTITVPDMPELKQTAEIIRKNWSILGIEVKISLVPLDKIVDEIIRPRNYEAILFGQVLSLDPDPFSFWHSSQKRDPGLNLSLYGNKNVDIALEKARHEIDLEKRMLLFRDFQEEITNDIPAIFLYSPRYLFIVKNNIKGVKTNKINLPADRFANIEEWYIKTRR